MPSLDSLRIDRRSDIPIWVQLKQRLTHLIVSGAYQPGEMLPTVRELAAQLDANYHTVNKVYRDLENSGLVEIKVGCGTRVAETSDAFNVMRNETSLLIGDFIESMFNRGMASEDIVYAVAQHLNLSVAVADGKQPAAPAEPTREGLRHVG